MVDFRDPIVVVGNSRECALAGRPCVLESSICTLTAVVVNVWHGVAGLYL
jgi:hypothetical protein